MPTAFLALRNVGKSKEIKTSTTIIIFNSNVKSRLLNGVETYTITKIITIKLPAFDNWCLCNILGLK